MALQEKQLGQLRPGNTTAASLYSPGASTTAIIKTIVVCNQTASSAKYRIFVDDDGTTYDQTTALFYDITIGANSTDHIDTYYAMNDANGNLAVRTDTNSALTFTCFGAEIT
jgi:hypothetical protein